MKSARRRRALEILIGLAPVTFLLLPFLAAGGMGLVISIFVMLADQQLPLSTRLQMVLPTAGVVAWIGCAVAGVFGVWLLVLLDWGSRPNDRMPRVVVGACLFVGLVAELRWFYVMLSATEGYELATWVWWLGLLVPPSVVGLLHLPELFRVAEPPARRGAAA